MTREPIAAALFAKLSGLAPVVTADRVMRNVNDLQPMQCPALFLTPKSHTAVRKTGLPARWDMEFLVYVYTKRGDASTVPDTQINAVLDAIEAALLPGPGMQDQNLGGLCDWCRIEGPIETDAGALGDAALAVVPIRIQVTT